MIWCCFATAWASSSSAELLVNGEGHHCRWFIYSPSEAFRLLKSISCADKLMYWSKATNHVICWSDSLEDAGVKETLCVYYHHQWGRENNIKTSSKKQHFFSCLAPTTESQKANGWLCAGCTFLEVELRVTGWEIKTARSWHETQQATTGQDRESGVGAPAGSTPRLVSRCRHSEHAEQTGAATTASDQRLDVLFKSWSWSNMHMVPTFNELEARKLPAVRLSDQTWRRHASGVRRVCRHVFQISAKLWIIQKKIKMSPVGQDLRESVLCRGRRVRSGELRLRAQRARRSSPRRLGNTSNNTLVPPPRRSSRYLLSPPFVLREKSPGDDAEAQQPLSCSFVPTRTCQLINCASRLCAAPQLLCPISARLLLYSL